MSTTYSFPRHHAAIKVITELGDGREATDTFFCQCDSTYTIDSTPEVTRLIESRGAEATHVFRVRDDGAVRSSMKDAFASRRDLIEQRDEAIAERRKLEVQLNRATARANVVRAAISDIRHAVLNERYQIEGEDFGPDRINAVLAVIDDVVAEADAISPPLAEERT